MKGKVTIVEDEVFISVEGLESILDEFFAQSQIVLEALCKEYALSTIKTFEAYARKHAKETL